MLTIVNQIPLIDEVYKYDVILFAMGINNSMAKGFSYDISVNFPEVADNEIRYQYGDTRKYGNIHKTESDGLVFFACYIKNPALKKRKNDVFVYYEYLDECLEKIKEKCHGLKIACPLLGNDEFDGNGDSNTIMGIFEKHFKKSGNLTLYLYKQTDFCTESNKKIKQALYAFKHGKITKETYFEICRVLEWRKTHGIYKEIPDDFVYEPKKKMKRKIRHNKNGVILKF